MAVTFGRLLRLERMLQAKAAQTALSPEMVTHAMRDIEQRRPMSQRRLNEIESATLAVLGEVEPGEPLTPTEIIAVGQELERRDREREESL